MDIKEKVYCRIGIYGGAFNPVHYAHLQVAITVTEYLKLDCLVWVPVGQAWYKSSNHLASAADRLAMLELAFQDIPQEVSKKWLINTFEMKRQGPSYTIDTVNYLKQHYQAHDWYLVMGMDQLAVFDTWQRWQDLSSCCHLAVVNRTSDKEIESATNQFSHLKYINIPFQKMNVSSSQIREIWAEDQGVAQMERYLPPKVWRYIEQHHLYQ